MRCSLGARPRRKPAALPAPHHDPDTAPRFDHCTGSSPGAVHGTRCDAVARRRASDGSRGGAAQARYGAQTRDFRTRPSAPTVYEYHCVPAGDGSAGR
ncbi:hypothetical protein FFA01_05050 [Frigoribacterium faeni]|uniref:Uncharacterized protein n=1 Tax=Frigoribacterium faeni TaxID=145483 RepID=A0ABQ0UL40_9MICO|nr:hypothetical protein FFA01_05050 [Frigoribacterium faeni]